MEDYIGKNCPFCKTEFIEGDDVKICDSCSIPHHQECWNENKGCSTFGCSEQHYESQSTNITTICASCGAILEADQIFCPKCGTQKNSNLQNECSKCCAKLEVGQVFCPKCGQRAGLIIDDNVASLIDQFNAGIVKKKKKAKVLPIIISIVLLICVVGGCFVYSTIQENKKEEATTAYKKAETAAYVDNAKSFQSIVLSSNTKIKTIGNKIRSNWDMYIRYKDNNYRVFDSVDEAVYNAQLNQITNITTVESNELSIDSLYTDLLKLPEGSDSDFIQIKTAIQNLYDSYTDMYNCVMVVTEDYTEFKSNFSEYSSAASEASTTLTNLLKAYE